jgi:hypothetical protein
LKTFFRNISKNHNNSLKYFHIDTKIPQQNNQQHIFAPKP